MKKIILAAVFLLSPLSAFALTVSPTVGSDGLVNIVSPTANHSFIAFMPSNAPVSANIFVQAKNTSGLSGGTLLTNLPTRTSPVNPLPKDLHYQIVEFDNVLTSLPYFCGTGDSISFCIAQNSGHVVAQTSYFYVTTVISGCTDPAAVNYNPSANLDDGSCSYTVPNGIDTLISNSDTSIGTTMSSSFSDLVGYTANTFIKFIIGTGLAVLGFIAPWMVAMIVILIITFAATRAYQFFKH